MPPPRRQTALPLGWWMVVLAAVVSAGCDDRALPSFADPPPIDAGPDAAADEDGGAEPGD